jgi:hypothetical protein
MATVTAAGFCVVGGVRSQALVANFYPLRYVRRALAGATVSDGLALLWDRFGRYVINHRRYAGSVPVTAIPSLIAMQR